MPRLTIRGLNGQHIIESSINECVQILALQSTPVIELSEGTQELTIYKCKRRVFNTATMTDSYEKGEIVTKVTVIIPEENTIYI